LKNGVLDPISESLEQCNINQPPKKINDEEVNHDRDNCQNQFILTRIKMHKLRDFIGIFSQPVPEFGCHRKQNEYGNQENKSCNNSVPDFFKNRFHEITF